MMKMDLDDYFDRVMNKLADEKGGTYMLHKNISTDDDFVDFKHGFFSGYWAGIVKSMRILEKEMNKK